MRRKIPALRCVQRAARYRFTPQVSIHFSESTYNVLPPARVLALRVN